MKTHSVFLLITRNVTTSPPFQQKRHQLTIYNIYVCFEAISLKEPCDYSNLHGLIGEKAKLPDQSALWIFLKYGPVNEEISIMTTNKNNKQIHDIE